MRRVAWFEVGRTLLGVGTYLAAVSLAVIVVATGVDRLATVWLAAEPAAPHVAAPPSQVAGRVQASPPAAEPLRLVRSSSHVTTQDAWNDRLRDPAFWARMKSGNGKSKSSGSYSSERSGLGRTEPPPSRGSSRSVFDRPEDVEDRDTRHSDGPTTYRTVCVRLCDGAFFPLSFSTTRDSFEDDADRCDKTCPGARLFVYRNPGAELEDMEDLKGQPYRRLPNAFLFRTAYEPSCKCRPHPWEDASRDQHRLYALAARRSKGDKSVTRELGDVKSRLKKAEQEAIAERKLAGAKPSSRGRQADPRNTASDGRAEFKGIASPTSSSALKETQMRLAPAAALAPQPRLLSQPPAAPREPVRSNRKRSARASN